MSEGIPSVDVTKCYGINCLDCRLQCELRECGIDVIREKQREMSRVRGTNANTVYIDAIKTRGKSDDDALPEYDEDGNEIEQPAGFDIAADGSVKARFGDGLAFLKRLNVVPDKTPDETVFVAWRIASDAIRTIFYMLESDNAGTVDLMRSIFSREKQADRARSAGISREAQRKRTNKTLATFAKILGVRKEDYANQSALLGLTQKEFAVYKVLFVDGCSERSAAVQLNLPKSTIHRMGQKLRLKLQKTGQTKTKKQEKTKKVLKKLSKEEMFEIALQKIAETQKKHGIRQVSGNQQFFNF